MFSIGTLKTIKIKLLFIKYGEKLMYAPMEGLERWRRREETDIPIS